MNYPSNNLEFYHQFSNLSRLKDFCLENGLLEKKSVCPSCKSTDNKIVIYRGNIYYRFCLNKCQRRWSARNNIFSFNKKSNLSFFKILEIFWYWSSAATIKDTASNCKLQKKIVISWFDKIRNYCHSHQLDASPMGGKGYNIQIDESLFRGKRKSNRGRLLLGDKKPKENVLDKLRSIVENNQSSRNYGNRVTGPWVFGMVLQDKKVLKLNKDIRKFNDKITKKITKGKESNVDKRKLNTKENRIYNSIKKHKFKNSLMKEAQLVTKEVRMFYVPKRDARNLLPLIVSNCKTKSEVVSDEWRAYKRIKNYDFKHFTVNHSKNFVDPKTKRHTQLIECPVD